MLVLPSSDKVCIFLQEEPASLNSLCSYVVFLTARTAEDLLFLPRAAPDTQAIFESGPRPFAPLKTEKQYLLLFCCV